MPQRRSPHPSTDTLNHEWHSLLPLRFWWCLSTMSGTRSKTVSWTSIQPQGGSEPSWDHSILGVSCGNHSGCRALLLATLAQSIIVTEEPTAGVTGCSTSLSSVRPQTCSSSMTMAAQTRGDGDWPRPRRLQAQGQLQNGPVDAHTARRLETVQQNVACSERERLILTTQERQMPHSTRPARQGVHTLVFQHKPHKQPTLSRISKTRRQQVAATLGGRGERGFPCIGLQELRRRLRRHLTA